MRLYRRFSYEALWKVFIRGFMGGFHMNLYGRFSYETLWEVFCTRLYRRSPNETS